MRIKESTVLQTVQEFETLTKLSETMKWGVDFVYHVATNPDIRLGTMNTHKRNLEKPVDH